MTSCRGGWYRRSGRVTAGSRACQGSPPRHERRSDGSRRSDLRSTGLLLLPPGLLLGGGRVESRVGLRLGERGEDGGEAIAGGEDFGVLGIGHILVGRDAVATITAVVEPLAFGAERDLE